MAKLIKARPAMAEERAALDRMLDSRTGSDVHQFKWALCLEQSWQGRTVPKIAKLVHLSEKRVRYRIKAWNAEGLKALERHKPPGRPRRLPKHLGEQIAEVVVQEKPQDYGWNESQWTLERLADTVVLNGWTDTICAGSIRLALKGEKLSYRRLKRWKPSNDPAYKRKKARRDYYLSKCDDPDWAVLFMDEAGKYLVRPEEGYGYGSRQHPAVIPSTWHTRGKVGLQAALDAQTDQVQVRFTLSFATDSTILYLIGLAWLYAGKKKWLAVIMDNAGGHISKAFRAWVRRWNRTAWERGLPRIVPVYLPTQSPWLNRIESYFRGMHRAVIAGSDYASPSEMQDHIARYFRERNQRKRTGQPARRTAAARRDWARAQPCQLPLFKLPAEPTA